MHTHRILPQTSSRGSTASRAASPDQGTPRSRTNQNKPKKMACVECRQQKSKCDAQDRHPNPCTRCVKKKIPCSLQSDYKRTYKRAKFQQIEEELEELKKNLSQAGVDSLLKQLQERKYQPHELNSPPTGTPQPQDLQQQRQLPPLRSALVHSPVPFQPSPPLHSQLSPRQSPFPQAQTQSQSQLLTEQGPSIIREPTPTSPVANRSNLQTNAELIVDLSEDVLRCPPKQFGEIELSSAQIRELYVEFVNKYHRFLPIVDVSKGPERIYRLCPVLFWTIASIALRHLSTDILMSLAPLLKTALAEITISPITRYFPNESEEPILNVSSVYSVQALLLYTYWPPLTSSLSADSSWNTVGIAIFQAIRIGLNGPGTTNYHVQQQNKNEMNKILQEHVKTWISCNIVSQTIATSFGFPAFVSFDSSVVGCVRPGSQIQLPTCLRQMVEIAHFEDQVSKVLNSNTVDAMGLVDPMERLPLLKVLTQQLNELELKLSSEGLDDIRKFQILAARVHLLTYYFLDNSRVANFELRRGLVSVFNAAVALISHASSVSNKDPKFFKCVPGMFVLKIWQSSCIIAKLVNSPMSDVLDIGAGRQLYVSAMQLANKASVLKHDMAYRSAGIMKNTWQLFKTLREKGDRTNLDVTVRSRMSASVFFDCLWLLREQIGMIKLDPHKKESSADISNNEDEDDIDEEEENELDEKNGPVIDPGTVNSEDSIRSTTSSQKGKRGRALSNSFDAEKSARKLIRTVPLDPMPIALRREASDSSPRPTISSILQKQSPDSSSTSSAPPRSFVSHSSLGNRPVQMTNKPFVQLDDTFPDVHVSPTNIPSLDLSDEWTNDMLWKDVDSVMNDFGFSTDDIQKALQPNGPSAISEDRTHAQMYSQKQKQGSLFGNYQRK